MLPSSIFKVCRNNAIYCVVIQHFHCFILFQRRQGVDFISHLCSTPSFYTLHQTFTPQKASQKLGPERKMVLHPACSLNEIDPRILQWTQKSTDNKVTHFEQGPLFKAEFIIFIRQWKYFFYSGVPLVINTKPACIIKGINRPWILWH